MNDLVLATTPADAAAAAAIVDHHARMSGALTAHVGAVLAAALGGDAAQGIAARDALARWCTEELLPHAAAEEAALYPAARGLPEGRLLIDVMLDEHVDLAGLAREVAAAGNTVATAAAARALQVLFDSHLRKENEAVVPLLQRSSDVALADLLEAMHAELAVVEPPSEQAAPGCGCGCGHEHATAPTPAPAPAAGGCGCGHADEPGYPELDARAVPHAIRHATVFGALEAVAPGGGLVLVAPHDPLPLLAQIEQRWPGVFTVSYLERGPRDWRLLLRHGDAADSAA